MRSQSGGDPRGETAARDPLRATPKQRGGVTGKGFLPGRSGNEGGRPAGDGLMRKRLLESFRQNEAQAMAAMARRWGNPKYVQDMIELLARLQGELNKEAGDGERARGSHHFGQQRPSPAQPSGVPRGGDEAGARATPTPSRGRFPVAGLTKAEPLDVLVPGRPEMPRDVRQEVSPLLGAGPRTYEPTPRPIVSSGGLLLLQSHPHEHLCDLRQTGPHCHQDDSPL